jgi:DNA-binding NarL/FixJ family response regulator
MKILIVDDHALFRHGLTLTLSELFDQAEITQAGCADEAIEIVAGDEQFDLVLVDLTMPGMNGFDGIRLIREHLDRAPIVVVTSSEDVADMRTAFGCGARGYVPKSSAAELLQHALPLVLAGELFVPAMALGVDAAPAPQSPGVQPDHDLDPVPPVAPVAKAMTPRQREVLTLLVQGQSNKEIARNLGMPDSTVKVHVKAILQKLGVKNRTQAAIAAMRQGHIPAQSMG